MKRKPEELPVMWVIERHGFTKGAGVKSIWMVIVLGGGKNAVTLLSKRAEVQVHWPPVM
jgi:hypothetical protein